MLYVKCYILYIIYMVLNLKIQHFQHFIFVLNQLTVNMRTKAMTFVLNLKSVRFTVFTLKGSPTIKGLICQNNQNSIKFVF